MYSTTAADHGGGTPITTIHPDIIQYHILNRLDGATLAAASCASSQLLSLCTGDHLWRQICNSTWPSTADPAVRDIISDFPSGHRSFYSDSFSSVRCHSQSEKPLFETSDLISAVDIYIDGDSVFSKVMATETVSGWFSCSPFRFDLLEPKETVATPLKSDETCIELAKERVRLSWIVIDPSKGRAINVASAKAVEARRHWLTEEIQVRYATVMSASSGGGDLVKCEVVVTLGGEMEVREVCMQMEDMEGRTLTGREILVILEGAMQGQRGKIEWKREEDIYERYLKMKADFREGKMKRERNLDLVCMVTGVSIFFGIWIFFLFR